MKQKLIAISVVVLIFSFYGAFLTQKVNLVTADLGRHIRNGEFLFSGSGVLTTNFYSYTEPNFPTINHHWAPGLLFYGLAKLGGPTSAETGIPLVQIFFVAASLVAFAYFFFLAKKYSSLGYAALAALPMIFLLSERTEIRPEVFSYLFAGIFLWILYKYRNQQSRARILLLLPVLQILWANSHIFFIMGPILIGAFMTEALFKNREMFWKLFGILAVVVLVSAINPFGIQGALEPLTILHEYGYRLAENQTVPFMLKLSANPNLRIFPAVFVLVLLSYIFVLFKFRKRLAEFPWVNLLLFAGFSFMAWYQIRNITYFGFAAMPLFAMNLKYLFGDKNPIDAALPPLLVIIALIASGNILHRFPYWNQFGIGIEPGNNAAIEFFKQNDLRGPIFNNYDNGGDLIYHLFPRERVLVDNRPEAYSVDFFKNLYVPMQEDGELWKTAEKEYNFNAIFFSYHDATPWGQNFLIQRIDDPSWAPVFIDNYNLIMLKRADSNRSIIDRFEIERSAFTTN